MDPGAVPPLAVMTDPKGLTGLLQRSSDPAAAKAVAKQFGALLMQSLWQQNDGSGVPMVEGTGGNIVNAMFANTMGQAAMAGEKLGLTDILLKSIEAKQQAAAGTGAKVAASSAAAAGVIGAAPSAAGFPLAAYWQANGMRPLAVNAALAHLAAANTATAGQNPVAIAQGALYDIASAVRNTAAVAPAPADASAGGAHQGGGSAAQIASFSQRLGPLLQRAAQQLGVSPKILLAQAAIETGWGRSVVGNNIFGIKAGSSWSGATVTAATHEYQDGQLVPVTDAFRAYPSLEAAVQDFVSLVSNSPRYRAVVGSGDDVAGYARGLLAGGWATDIDYARKLATVASGNSVNAAFTAPVVPALPPATAL